MWKKPAEWMGVFEATRVDSFSTDVSVICDLLPNADPANYDKHKTWYNFGFMDKMMSVSGEPGVLQVVQVPDLTGVSDVYTSVWDGGGAE